MKKKAPDSPGLPPIFRTDASGVKWTFSPTEDRWTATIGDRSMSSADFSKLVVRAKEQLRVVGKPTDNATSNPAAAALPDIEAALLMVNTNGMRGARHELFQPVLAKLQWSAEHGTYRVARYKPTGASGWHSGALSSGCTFFHPDALNAQAKQVLCALAVHRVLTHALKKTAQAVSQAWWSAAKDDVHVLQRVDGALVPAQVTAPLSRMSSGRMAFVSSGWPCLVGSSVDPRKWESQPDGSYRQGAVSVSLSEDLRVRPQFQVRADTWPDPLFCGSFHTAMALAEATVALLAQQPNPIMEWRGTPPAPSTTLSMPSWPRLHRVWGGTIAPSDSFGSSTGPERGMSLSLECDSVLRPASDVPPASPKWSIVGEMGMPALVSASANDVLFDRWDALLRQAQEYLLPAQGQDLDWRRSSALVFDEEPLLQAGQQTLADLTRLAQAGPLESDPDKIQAQFRAQQAVISQASLADERLLALLAACEQLSTQAPSLAAPPAPPSKLSRPR
jgi:hypothetical protein